MYRCVRPHVRASHRWHASCRLPNRKRHHLASRPTRRERDRRGSMRRKRRAIARHPAQVETNRTKACNARERNSSRPHASVGSRARAIRHRAPYVSARAVKGCVTYMYIQFQRETRVTRRNGDVRCYLCVHMTRTVNIARTFDSRASCCVRRSRAPTAHGRGEEECTTRASVTEAYELR